MTHRFPTRAYRYSTDWYWPWRGSLYYRCTDRGIELIEADRIEPVHLGRMEARRLDAFGFPHRTIQTWQMIDRDPVVWAATIGLPEEDARPTTCSGLHFGTCMEEAVDTAYRTVRQVRRALAERTAQQKALPTHVVGGRPTEGVVA